MLVRRFDRIEHWRRRALAGAIALALAAPGVVYPCTLDQLLALPLDCLLQVEFTPAGAPHRAAGCALAGCRMTEREAR